MARNIKPKPNGLVFCGMREIAEIMRVSQPCIHRWIKELGFPVVYSKGEVTTTMGAIDAWVLAISSNASRYPVGGQPWFVASSAKPLSRMIARQKRLALEQLEL